MTCFRPGHHADLPKYRFQVNHGDPNADFHLSELQGAFVLRALIPIKVGVRVIAFGAEASAVHCPCGQHGAHSGDGPAIGVGFASRGGVGRVCGRRSGELRRRSMQALADGADEGVRGQEGEEVLINYRADMSNRIYQALYG